MNLPPVPPIKKIVLLIASSIACVALAGCGNKGPLVRSADVPAATPAAEPAVVEPAVDPAAPPASEPASGTPDARR